MGFSPCYVVYRQRPADCRNACARKLCSRASARSKGTAVLELQPGRLYLARPLRCGNLETASKRKKIDEMALTCQSGHSRATSRIQPSILICCCMYSGEG